MSPKTMPKLFGLFIAVAVFAVVVVAALSDRSHVEQAKESPLMVPNFSAVSVISGKEVTQVLFQDNSYKLLNVWASWCGICKKEHETLLQIADAGVPIIGLNYRDSNSAAQNYLSSKNNPYQDVISDPNGELAVDLGVIGTPETYLIDQSGKVLIKYRGAITIDKWNSIFSRYFNGAI
ncbi:DsbE family thiol:disulfide interchange protein [Vibrio parahaemolyticus]|uniref:DsbE family thiol:disulfide interchange protein n=1 Tax=Vibrio TaxID=662 RepID=UPI0003F7D1FF|nr:MULTISPECIES: DsbE family thiol:disulfide interchange protein [Vibrio]KIT41574.1 thiol:disulfide interchange protein DsbE [Vibrio parahaemolyticus 3644]KIT58885.1 thiol:disulfide interchange protein DsbE [Vibrio parahaemolyticus EN9701072]EGQ7680366.1 DsbE family thiol:disulfide interchange protein [Vibrio parahaemolyticus]EGQ7822635.1 DsbE family thiol:disulfide interchange protein [Vibrio parahaemolyticus]EGQ8241558.1 DsbE family thiol:disulfide interchange protein [Vibrio parahaemolyticu